MVNIGQLFCSGALLCIAVGSMSTLHVSVATATRACEDGLERLVFESVATTAPDVVSAPVDLPEELSWMEWRRAFGKVYATAAEAERRQRIFAETLTAIRAQNARNDAGESTYRMGVNQFSDLTNEEYRKGYLSRPLQRTAEMRVERLSEAHVRLGATIDWRTKGAVTPVKNQGQCGSCWAFSTTGSLEGAYYLATGALRSASEQQLVDCSSSEGNKGCSGGLMEQGFKYIIANKGIDSEDDYTYTAADGKCWTNATHRVVATIDSYKDVPKNEEAQLAAAVLKQPVSVAIEADQSGFQSYKSGIFDAACGNKLDHGVLVVGLTEDAYIVKNSWGASWGEKGYIQMKRNANATDKGGICGIAMQPTYPVKAKGAPASVPPLTPNSTRPKPPPACPGCTPNMISTCGAFGMHCCCGQGGNTNCHPSPQCCCKGDACPTPDTLF